jgi:C4-dicarboxylate transporter, DctM subunit
MIWLIAIVAGLMLFAGFEMFLVLAVPGYLVKAAYFPMLPDAVLVQRLIGGINHNLLLAIPFFIFAAEMMAGGRLAGLLSGSAQACFRRVRGGAGHATIAGSMAFGAVSGSAPATVAALGRILYPSLRDSGFSNSFSLGLIVAAAETALLIPPSISLIIYGWLTETSITRLFAAGLVVGIVLGLAFSVLVLIEVARRGQDISSQALSSAEATKEVVKGTAWALGMPVIILGGIYSGVFTATEAAAVSVVYAVLIEATVFRTLTVGRLLRIAQRSAVMTSAIFILLAVGSIIAYFVILAQLPQALLELMHAVGAGPLLFLLIVNITFLVAGMFIDPGTAMVILVPALFPVASSFGIDPVHFGLVVCLNVCTAMITPPFGLDIFVAASTLEKPVLEVTRGVAPFIGVNLVVLLIVTYVPDVATFFPNLLLGS